jgi:hypothetical protein
MIKIIGNRQWAIGYRERGKEEKIDGEEGVSGSDGLAKIQRLGGVNISNYECRAYQQRLFSSGPNQKISCKHPEQYC